MTRHETIPVSDSYFVIAGGDWLHAKLDFATTALCEPFTPPHSLAVTCGKQNGDVEVTWEALSEPPPPLTAVPEGWQEAMEVSLNTEEPPVLIETALGDYAIDDVPVIDTAGWTRFRVLATGRAAARVDDTLPEAFSITAWPEPGDRPPVTF